MKSKILSFFKPRVWTLTFALFLTIWEYIYVFRGVDFTVLSQIRTYFGFAFVFVNWNDFLIRTISLGLIWLVVAVIIFFLLWLFESIAIRSYNRKIARKYVNKSKAEYAHLLKRSKISFKDDFISHLWLSGFFILIVAGIFFVSGLVEQLRTYLVIAYLTAAQESGTLIDYNDISVITASFILTFFIWYLYACLDTWCVIKGREDSDRAKIEEDHYAVPVDENKKDADEDLPEEKDGTDLPSPVI